MNYGLYCPPTNGRAGKFLDEERPLRDYPMPGPIGFLEVCSTCSMIVAKPNIFWLNVPYFTFLCEICSQKLLLV